MDYALPRASDMPEHATASPRSPSPLNPLGVKGVGEGGAVAPPAAIANAVSDALSVFGVEFNATPIRAEHVVNAAAGANAAHTSFGSTIGMRVSYRDRIRYWSTRPAQGGFAVPHRTRPLSPGYHAAEHGICGDRSLPPRARPHQGDRHGQGARDAGCHRRLHRRRLSRRWAQSRSRTTPPWPGRPMSRCG